MKLAQRDGNCKSAARAAIASGQPKNAWRSSRSSLLALSIVSVVAVLSSGCGNVRNPPFSPKPTAGCLEDRGYDVLTGNLHDVVASTASRGALRARWDDNDVTITFGENEQEAERILRGYRRFMPRERAAHIGDVSEIHHNALLLWAVTPPRENHDEIVDCLRSSR